MKNYDCEFCGKHFDRKSNLDTHKNKKKPCNKKKIKKDIQIEKDIDINDEDGIKKDIKINFNIKDYNIKLTQNEIDALNNFNIDDDKIQEFADNCECAYCGKKYANKSNVMHHIRNNCKKVKKMNDVKNTIKEIKEEAVSKLKCMEEYEVKYDENFKILKEENKAIIKENKIINREYKEILKDYAKIKEENKEIKQELIKIRNEMHNFKKIIQPDQFEKSSVEKTKEKKKIPPNFRMLVWDKNIGLDKGKSLCLCCKKREITQMDFHCGHIISEANGGKLHVDNLLPICAVCNYSMGTENLYVHQQKLENFES
jgi:hypothetical protein